MEALRPAMRRLVVRRFGAEDLAKVERLLLALDFGDRQARFHFGVSDWWIGAYAGGLDPARAILIGGFWERRLVGLAEAHHAGAADAVEMAVVVERSCRRAGLGTRLVREALTCAFAEDAQAAEFAFGADNAPMIAFLGALGAKVHAVPGHAVIERRAGFALQRAA
jgi:GNAT superfamily N-acetyltransferase